MRLPGISKLKVSLDDLAVDEKAVFLVIRELKHHPTAIALDSITLAPKKVERGKLVLLETAKRTCGTWLEDSLLTCIKADCSYRLFDDGDDKLSESNDFLSLEGDNHVFLVFVLRRWNENQRTDRLFVF